LKANVNSIWEILKDEAFAKEVLKLTIEIPKLMPYMLRDRFASFSMKKSTKTIYFLHGIYSLECTWKI